MSVAVPLAALALAAGLVSIPDASATAPGRTIDRHSPVLVYDSDEEYFARSVGTDASTAVYGHLARDGGATWLQYWIYYAYNPQDRGLLRTGRHEGDWELLQVRLGGDGRPDLATLAQHSWAAGCRWSELRHEGEAPVVYVANGSHALYPRPGTWDRPFPDPNDEADGRGRRSRPPVHEITDGRPAWVERREPWGHSRAGWIPGEQSSPVGPKFQDSGAWWEPGRFHDDQARGCFAGPPSRPWQTAGLAGLVVVLVGGATVLLRRRFIQSRR